MKTWLITARIWSSRSICALDNRLGLKYRLIPVRKLSGKNSLSQSRTEVYLARFRGIARWFDSITYILGSFNAWRSWLLTLLLTVDLRLCRFPCSFSLYSFLEIHWRALQGLESKPIVLDWAAKMKVWKLAYGQMRDDRYRFLHTAPQFLVDLLRS